MNAADLRQLLETGLADDTHATLEAIRQAFETFREVVVDMPHGTPAGRPWHIDKAVHAVERLQVAIEGGDGAPRVGR